MAAPSMHGNVASVIGHQVEQMILQAKKDSESRVRHELNLARTQLQQMEGVITDLGERIARCNRSSGLGGSDQSQTVDRAFLNQKIQQLEQKWGSEVKALKQDLHRTILAHNHNSDLMRHHRDALDEARRKLDTLTQPKAEQVDAQIEKVERMFRHSQAKQKELENLAHRLSQLEIQVNELLPNPNAMPPYAGLAGMGGMNALLAQQQAQAAAQTREPQPKRAGKKELTADEEELRRLYLQAHAQTVAKAGSNFNAEAPVFVPTAAASEDATVGEGTEAADGKVDLGGDDIVEVDEEDEETAPPPGLLAGASAAEPAIEAPAEADEPEEDGEDGKEAA
mmetsp:Transcript_44972/g.82168  ORF Transcript_44972/g.82168 Transcript_44972/m.82168 type:complete len:338 (+) Transcript_44972:86-1099(+)